MSVWLFRELLGRHYDRVFRVVYSVLRDTSEAEDVTQEIWAAMPSKLRQWRGKAKLTSWLHRIALNAAKDSLRRAATRAKTAEGYAEIESLSRAEMADTQKRLTWLQTALGTLSDDLRETAVLTLSEEMNFAQAADVLGVAEGTLTQQRWRKKKYRLPTKDWPMRRVLQGRPHMLDMRRASGETPCQKSANFSNNPKP